MLVLDASAAIAFLLNLEPGDAIAERLSQEVSALHTPHLLDLEILQVLRRLTQRSEITAARANDALADFRSLRLRRYSHAPLSERIWELRTSVSAYDASYIALAEALDASLITSDAALSRSRGHNARIELYA